MWDEEKNSNQTNIPSNIHLSFFAKEQRLNWNLDSIDTIKNPNRQTRIATPLSNPFFPSFEFLQTDTVF